jgi:outer membrane protein TolC
MADQAADAAISQYRNVLYMRFMIEIKESALESLEKQHAILETEEMLGIAIVAELNEAEIKVEEAKLELMSLAMDLDEAEIQFAQSMGMERLPPLLEKIDVNRRGVIDLSGGSEQESEHVAVQLALAQNVDLNSMRLSIKQKQEELKYASRSWLPTIKATGSAGFSGRDFPLTNFTWSAGISLEFSTPWLSGGISGASEYVGRYERSTRVGNSTTPAPNPAAALSKQSAALSLALEQDNYRQALEQTSRQSAMAVKKCGIAEKKRLLAIQAEALARQQYKIDEIKHELGQITRVELMESRVNVAEKEIECVKAAVALLSTERDLETLLNLPPGSLLMYFR